MTDEERLLEKLSRIEALHAGATTEGERDAAAHARGRIQEKLRSLGASSPPEEFQFSMADPWSRKMLLALLRRYELKPYRHAGQRHSTVMVKMPRRFLDETLWPEFTQLNDTLHTYLREVTDRVIAQAVDKDTSEAVEVKQLGPGRQ